MMFTGDDALKKVSVLSGGEKSRVLLGKILAQPSNVLLLDEPTNHLDMESIEALIDSLKTYQGAVILVTHSELILRSLVNRLIVFQGNAPKLFDHEYDYFLEKEGWEEEGGASPSSHEKNSTQASQPKMVDKEATKKIAQYEREISSLEEGTKKLEHQIAELYSLGKSEEALQHSHKLNQQKSKIESLFEELVKLST
jgi:ATP-binding cassette subfamily F protein 3